MDIDTTKWSGDGDFTQVLIDRLREIDTIALLRIEDAPATRTEADYHFLSNEIFVAFATKERRERVMRFGVLPTTRILLDKQMTIDALGERLTLTEGVGEPDYADAKMLQYLRTERIIPPYQTRGYKLVELVRLYEV